MRGEEYDRGEGEEEGWRGNRMGNAPFTLSARCSYREVVIPLCLCLKLKPASYQLQSAVQAREETRLG